MHAVKKCRRKCIPGSYRVRNLDGISIHFLIPVMEQECATLFAARYANSLPSKPRGVIPAERFQRLFTGPKHSLNRACLSLIELDQMGKPQ